MSVWEDSEWVEKIAAEESKRSSKVAPDPHAIMHVQPMTGPIEGVDFYRPRYLTSYPTKQFDQDGKEPR